MLEVDPDAAHGNLDRPKQTNWGESSRIEIMNLIARTGQIDVNSNQGEGRLMLLPVRATERALHEPHIGIDKW